MDFAPFCRSFRQGCLASTQVEASMEVLHERYLRLRSLVESGRVVIGNADGYAFRMGRNWSIDQTLRAASALRRANASAAHQAEVNARDKQVRLFFLALEEAEASFFDKPAMIQGAEALRRILRGETTPSLMAEFGIKRDALYKRISRVREAVMASGLVSEGQFPLLFVENGNFRSLASIEAETGKIRRRIR